MNVVEEWRCCSQPLSVKNVPTRGHTLHAMRSVEEERLRVEDTLSAYPYPAKEGLVRPTVQLTIEHAAVWQLCSNGIAAMTY